MTNNSNYIAGFDVLKFILAILIVAAHTQFLTEYTAISPFLGSLKSGAIPTFFAVSAYLFIKRLDGSQGDDRAVVTKTIKRLCIIFGVWYVLMLPMTYIVFFKVATFKETIYAMLMTCTFNGYWFFKALIINTIILYFCRKHLKSCFLIGLLLYGFWSYNYLYHFVSLSISPYYSFYYSIAYFSIGALLARYKEMADGVPLSMLIVNVVIHATVPCIAPICCLLYPIILIPMFCKIKIKNIALCKSMRVQSILFYVMQFVLIWLYNNACKYFLAEDSVPYEVLQHSVVRFVVVLGLLFLLSHFIMQSEKNPKFYFLRYLH